jgi:hypothetical protein
MTLTSTPRLDALMPRVDQSVGWSAGRYSHLLYLPLAAIWICHTNQRRVQEKYGSRSP